MAVYLLDTNAFSALMGENDLWIAATAMDRNAVLVSSDSDFRRIGGLALEDWSPG